MIDFLKHHKVNITISLLIVTFLVLIFAFIFIFYTPVKAISSDPGEYVCPDDALYRLVVPSIGLSVACYEGKAQEIVDGKDSAAVFDYNGDLYVADHNYQGFNVLRSCVPGTKAFVIYNDGRTVNYISTSKISGYNTGKFFLDNNREELVSETNNGMICYTCNVFDEEKVTFVFFEKYYEAN